ncbi:MAG: HEPN domain-containing protein [Candidatus Moraniibacteriota bacterium]
MSNEANLLNQFYIETRYVGDYPDFSWNDAKQAYEAAKKIKEFVLSEIAEK